MNASPQLIAATVRRLMATKDWSWRYGAVITDGSDSGSADCRAANILRRDYARAGSWLRQVSAMTTLPLPEGNGINGPWQRTAYVTETGRYALVDVATGRAVEHSCYVPEYVARFAAAHPRATSVNQAGGSGGAPTGWRQLLIVLYSDSRSVRVRLPRSVSARLVIYGLQTCYGTIGRAPSEQDCQGWQAIAEVDTIATIEPQREQLQIGSVQESMWRDYAASARLAGSGISYAGGHTSIGTERLQYVYVTGRPAQRAAIRARVEREWPEYVRQRAALAAAELAEKIMSMNGLRHTERSAEQGARIEHISNYGCPRVQDVLARLAE